MTRRRRDLNSRLDRQLVSYAIAAGAGCIGMLAVPSAAAKVVYTPTEVSIGVRGNIPINLNNDGISDFKIFGFSCEHSNCLVVNPLVYGNGIKAGTGVISQQGFAGAEVFGIPVGPEGNFLIHAHSSDGGGSFVGFMADENTNGSGGSHGPWADTANRYLGFRFLIDGKYHFGWARLSVNMVEDRIVLTGYAYETIPEHRIIAGDTQGLTSETISPTNLTPEKPEPSLGVLARGADGLAAWRREDSVVTPQ